MSAVDRLNKIPNYNDLLKENKQLKENYERIYNENCILREKHNINDIGLLDENYKLKQIIDKAIEYLEQKPVVMVNGEPREIYVEDDNKLLDILKEGKKGVNRKFIGIELSKDYFDIATKRIENYFTRKEK